MRKLTGTVSLLLLFTVLNGTPAFALSCVEMPPVEEAYEKYDAVIVGQVDEISRKGEHHEVKVTVQRSFKGVEADQITMIENSTWGNLNGPSDAGETYLYFLRITDDEQWENPLCSPSMKAGEAGNELAYLEDKELPITLDPVPVGDSTEADAEEEPFAVNEPSDSAEQEENQRSASTSRTVIAIALVMLMGGAVYLAVSKRSRK
ncbi:hypothetical protein DUZ99_03590 [Xylanibacillus composti]|uniref:Tissue inhibitor of metalloproteinase n=1 Tax=Xylanibacillus composti TaxID=1572762 RepID=A0A8J4H4J8_9BACL|nr:hypothetical protein [Xylanibacillus composti]MDT9724083.1 hypothetical protein [Xylanibacillus composti]GIQ69476.1 hypothetical protein XYCOK13_23000 [Xylanibacillus composti]